MKDVIQQRLERYQTVSPNHELNALKEITQEVTLYALYKAGMFEKAAFLGGTSLRIIHGLRRFSEDLDFATLSADDSFSLYTYIEKAAPFIDAYGYDFELQDPPTETKTIQGLFIKDQTIKKHLRFKFRQDPRLKLKIKIEIDTNPPEGSKSHTEYVDFPFDFPVTTYDLPSLMSGKLHALLCRPYAKGRDWYDFLWYLANDISCNRLFLQNALNQNGPWKGKNRTVELEFLQRELIHRAKEISWKKITEDVRRFLPAEAIESLQLWRESFFVSKINSLNLTGTTH